jgi:hypothetical protein
VKLANINLLPDKHGVCFARQTSLLIQEVLLNVNHATQVEEYQMKKDQLANDPHGNYLQIANQESNF